MLSLGIAIETTGWRAAVWDEERAADLHVFGDVEALWDVTDAMVAKNPALPAVLPSGLGVPVTRARDLLDRDIYEMTFRMEVGQADRLAALLAEARHRLPRGLCIPGVKALPSVPLHRKLGRPDLGAADSLCAATWAIYARERGEAPTTFLLLHCQDSSRRLVVVKAGRILDGLGASALGLGPDSEDTRTLPSSGPGVWWHREAVRLAEAESRTPGSLRAARWEGVEKEIRGFLSLYELEQVLVVGAERERVLAALVEQLPCASLPSPADGYESALGAAVIAAGLTGGPTASLVDRLGLREARDRVLDFVRP